MLIVWSTRGGDGQFSFQMNRHSVTACLPKDERTEFRSGSVGTEYARPPGTV